MSLSRNDMLSTEVGGAPRARRSCYVNEPAYGFFIAGSSVKGMNGVYIRRNPPGGTEEDEEGGARNVILYYEHMDTPWTLGLVETTDPNPSPYFGHSLGERSEWLFMDERSQDRFAHKGDTIVPGAGVSWKHVHRTSSGARARPATSPRRDWREQLGFASSTQLAEANEDNEDELPWQVRPRRAASRAPLPSRCRLALCRDASTPSCSARPPLLGVGGRR
jgi:hypothetical protein